LGTNGVTVHNARNYTEQLTGDLFGIPNVCPWALNGPDILTSSFRITYMPPASRVFVARHLPHQVAQSGMTFARARDKAALIR